jgi:flagellar basal-body rod modification protein FlgD
MAIPDVSKSTTPILGAPQRYGNALSSLDFMHLLVVELQHQNPLEPMSTTDMASQLSQMTMAQQLTEINQAMDANVAMSQSINNTAMLALVGRQVTVAGKEVHVADGTATGSMINTKAPGTATVRVLDADGNEVAVYVRQVTRGLSELDWDGRLANGDAAADGAYEISVSVVDGDGNKVEATTLMTGPVRGLRYDRGLAVVNVFGQEFFVSEIYQVS